MRLALVSILLSMLAVPPFAALATETYSNITPIQVRVDFARPAWFPLDKTRVAVFQEADVLPGEQILESLKAHPELRLDSFRLLISQGNKTRLFNSPLQFGSAGGETKVAADADLLELLDYMQGHGILPVITLFNIPKPFRAAGNSAKTIPSDCSAYAAALQRYVGLFKKYRPLVWEIWNEPNLDRFMAGTNRAEDYLRIYAAVMPAVRRGDPDGMVAGPVSAGARPAFCKPFFKMLEAKPALRPDYISFHHYGRFPWRPGDNRKVDLLKADFALMRRLVGDGYDQVPFIITEYEHYPAGTDADIRQQQENRETTLGAATFLSDLDFFLKQPDVAYVHWNRFRKNGLNNRPGGVFDYDGTPLPHYYARQAFGAMPEERVQLNVANGDDVQGMASLDDRRAAILLWSTEPGPHPVQVRTSGLPHAKFGQQPVVRVSRYDTNLRDKHASPVVRETAYRSTLPMEIDGPGFVLIQMNSGQKTAAPRGLQHIAWLRSYRLCGRQGGAVTGNYAIPDSREWVVRLGTRKPGSETAGGFRMGNLPGRMRIATALRGDVQPPEFGALIIYELNGASSPVVFAPSGQTGTTIAKLPWNKAVAHYAGAFPNNRILDFDQHAPKGWSETARQASVLFWMRGKSADTQAVIRLTDSNAARTAN